MLLKKLADSRLRKQLKEQKEEMAANGTVSFFSKVQIPAHLTTHSAKN